MSTLGATWSNWKDTVQDVDKIVKTVKRDAELAVKVQFKLYSPLVYKSAEEVGKKYVIKVYVGENQIVNLIVWQSDDELNLPKLKKAEIVTLPEIYD